MTLNLILNGSPTSYYDKFKNKKWLASTILGMTIVFFVLMSSTSKLGTLKFQKIELIDQSQFIYNASDVLTFNAISLFEVDQLLPLVK